MQECGRIDRIGFVEFWKLLQVFGVDMKWRVGLVNPQVYKKWFPDRVTAIDELNRRLHIVMHKHLGTRTVECAVVIDSVGAEQR